jgi:hypothetical protein
MDAAHLAQMMALAGIVLGLARFLLHSLDLAEAGFASLFVPPDRTLGWPHGVQESDAPCGWQPAAAAIDPEADEIIADFDPGAQAPTIVHAGSYVEPTRLVAPVHLRALPQ